MFGRLFYSFIIVRNNIFALVSLVCYSCEVNMADFLKDANAVKAAAEDLRAETATNWYDSLRISFNL